MNRIEEIKQRLEAVTPGQWEYTGYCRIEVWEGEDATDIAYLPAQKGDLPRNGSDGMLIAHAPQDLAYLISEVERLQAEDERGTA